MSIKKQIRILGIDDLPFRKSQKQVLVIGAVFRGGEYMDGLLSTAVRKDGLDATEKISKMINKSRTKGQLSVVMLNGITFAGFNVVDLPRLSRRIGLPVIAVMRDRPDFKAIWKALKHLLWTEKRMRLIKKAGEIYEYAVKHPELRTAGKIYFQIAGLSEQDARKLLKLTICHSLIPEPLRVAHIIGAGLRFGESKGRA